MKKSYPKLHSYKAKTPENVAQFTGLTRWKIDPKKPLLAALQEPLKEVIILGVLEDGSNWFAVSNPNKGDILLLVEQFKKNVV